MEALLAKFFTEDEGEFRGEEDEFLKDMMQVTCDQFIDELTAFHKPDPAKELVDQHEELKLRVFGGELDDMDPSPKMAKAFVESACKALMEAIEAQGLSANDKIIVTYFTFDHCTNVNVDDEAYPEWGHPHKNTASLGPPLPPQDGPEVNEEIDCFTCTGMWVIATLKLKCVPSVFTLANV